MKPLWYLILVGFLPLTLSAQNTFDPGNNPGPAIAEFAAGTLTGISGGYMGYSYARGHWASRVEPYDDPLWRFFSSTASVAGFAVGEALGSAVGVYLTARYGFGYRDGNFLNTLGGATIGTILGVLAGASGYDARSTVMMVTAFLLPATGAVVGYHWDYFWNQWNGKGGSSSTQAARPPVVIPLFALKF